MQTERQRQATEIRAQGEQAARRIRAEADRTATVIVAEANGEASRLQRRRRSRSATASSPMPIGKDPEFFAFYRSMLAYTAGLKGGRDAARDLAGFGILPLFRQFAGRRRSAAELGPFVPGHARGFWWASLLRPSSSMIGFEHADAEGDRCPFALRRQGQWPALTFLRPWISPRISRLRSRCRDCGRLFAGDCQVARFGPGIGRRSGRAAARRGGQHLDLADGRGHARRANRRPRPMFPTVCRSRISSTSSSATTNGAMPDARPRRVQSLGSGFVIDASGIIVTNNHVIEDADEITANFSDGSKLHGDADRPRREDRPRAPPGQARRSR